MDLVILVYCGGRWWIDDGDGIMEPEGEDHYFFCPLLGPGMNEAHKLHDSKKIQIIYSLLGKL